MTDISEQELIARARKDPAAFAPLFERYYSPILGYVVRRVGDVALAQDIVSDTFVTALDKLWQFRWRGVPFSAWLYRIAGNKINAHWRSRPDRKVSLDYLQEAGVDFADDTDVLGELQEAQREVERHQQFRQAQVALRRLPERYQEALALRFFEHKKVAQIADILGKKEGTIKSLLSRGLAMLAKDMQPKSPQAIVIVEDEGR